MRAAGCSLFGFVATGVATLRYRRLQDDWGGRYGVRRDGLYGGGALYLVK